MINLTNAPEMKPRIPSWSALMSGIQAVLGRRTARQQTAAEQQARSDSEPDDIGIARHEIGSTVARMDTGKA